MGGPNLVYGKQRYLISVLNDLDLRISISKSS